MAIEVSIMTVAVLVAEGPVAIGGGVLNIALSSSGILHSVAIFPITASTEPTGVSSMLFIGEVLETQVVPYGTASSGPTYPLAVVSHFEPLPLPDDRTYILRTNIFNASGAEKIWRVVAIVEVKQ